MDTIKIENYQKGQEIEISQLIKRVYDEFVSHDYNEEGNLFFYDWILPDKIAKRQTENRYILVATSGSRIIGVIEIRDDNRISLLFVDKEFQGQGIAKRLFGESIKVLTQKGLTINKMYVHASPFSIPIYKKLGFIETDSLQENNGIKYMPMEIRVKDQNTGLTGRDLPPVIFDCNPVPNNHGFT